MDPELKEALEEVRAHRLGLKVLPSQTFALKPSEIRGIREKYLLSQDAFAALFGVSIRTLQQWEQGRREPQGPARALLRE